MNNGDGAKNFAFGFLAGAVLGAVGALIIAPMSGASGFIKARGPVLVFRFRRELSREGQKLSNRISETAEVMRDKSSDVYGSAAEVVSDAALGLKNAAQVLAR
jgi:gas vesicle protein